MSIKYLSHTADICMELEANSLKELFSFGVKGMGNILKEDFCNQSHKSDISEIVTIKATDNTNLLIDLLSEVLSLSYTKKAIYCNIDFLELTQYKVNAEIFGTQIESLDEEIKAVTYHEANVKKNTKGLWETRIIFDI